MKLNNLYLYFFFIVFFLHSTLSSSKELEVDGLYRLKFEDLQKLTSIDLTKKNFDDNDINSIIYDLYNSEQFINLTSKIINDRYHLQIEEAPIIENIYFNGNIFLKDDILISFLNSKKNSFLNQKVISSDINLIKDIYSQKGFTSINISVLTEKYSNSRVNVIFDINEGEVYELSNIKFVGNESFSANYLYSLIKSKEKKIYNFLGNASPINKSIFDNDLKILTNFYKKKGFEDVDIKYSVNLNYFNQYLLTFYFSENNRYSISNIDYEISDQIRNLENFNTLKNHFENELIKNNQNYDYDIFDKFLSEVNNSIFNANLNYELLYDVSKINNQYDIKFYNISYTPTIINSINIYGNSITKNDVLLSKLTINPGDYYYESNLKKSQETLSKLKYINKAEYSISTSVNKTDVIFDIDENKKTGSLLLGGSFTGDVGLGVFFSIKDYNSFGTGNEIQSDISLNSEVALFNITYKQYPYSNPNIANTYNIQNQEKDYTSSFGYKLDQVGFGYLINFKLNETIDISSGAEYANLKGHTPVNKSESAINDNIGTFDDIYLKLIISSDTTNDILYPNNGTYNSISFKYSPQNISDNNFYTLNYKGDLYHKLNNSENYFFISNRFGLTESINGRNKTINAFSLGGNNFKGFDYRGIGKRSSSKRYIGGNKYFTSTIGYGSSFLFDEKDNIYLKYFYTIGSLWDSDYLDQDFNLRSSVGLSLDILSPVGPIAFSYAIPIEKQSDDIQRSFNFSIGTSF